MSALWLDFRYTLRVLRRSPVFSVVAILSLALGIGGNIAIFTLINALLLRQLPVAYPEQLVQISLVRRDNKPPLSFPMFREIERNQRVFTGLFAWSNDTGANVEVHGALEMNRVLGVTGKAYSELGTVPLLGRLLTPADCDPDSANANVAVIGYEYWQRRFGGVADVVGSQIRIEGHPYTIVGVTRKWFTGLSMGEPPEVTVPVTAETQITKTPILETRSILWLGVFGRLKEGVTIEQARAQLQSFWPEMLLATVSTDTPGPRRDAFLSMGLEVAPAARGRRSDLRDQFAQPLYILAGIVGLILLVACVNLANLMLARAAARAHEMSVRVAIGADRGSLVRQVLIESLTLSLSGALLGLAFAYWGSQLLLVMMTAGNPSLVSLDLAPDFRVVAATVVIALFVGLLFGLAPAWRAARQDPAKTLRRNARGSGSGLGFAGKSLIVAQIALSLVLLLGAGLLVGSFQRLRTVNTGFQPQRVLEIQLNQKPLADERVDNNVYRRELLQRISSLPGAMSASFSENDVPGEPRYNRDFVALPGETTANAHVTANAMFVSPRFFNTLGIPMLKGRDFSDADGESKATFGIVNRSLAARLFPDGDAVGKVVRYSVMPEFQNIQIIGITDDARVMSLRDATVPVLYLSTALDKTPGGNLFVRTTQAPEAFANVAAREIDSLGREYAVRTRTIDQIIGQDLVEERVIAALSGFFSGLALLLASIGLYGLMSFGVIRRTREIGIRVAVGAQRENILWMVLRETLTLAVIGIAIGVPSGIAAARLVAAMLFGVTASDLPTLTLVSCLMLGVSAMAGFLPALRASRVDPIEALRTD